MGSTYTSKKHLIGETRPKRFLGPGFQGGKMTNGEYRERAELREGKGVSFLVKPCAQTPAEAFRWTGPLPFPSSLIHYVPRQYSFPLKSPRRVPFPVSGAGIVPGLFYPSAARAASGAGGGDYLRLCICMAMTVTSSSRSFCWRRRASAAISSARRLMPPSFSS